jgi:hypothetical protein
MTFVFCGRSSNMLIIVYVFATMLIQQETALSVLPRFERSCDVSNQSGVGKG